MLVVEKNGKSYGPLVNSSELAELLGISREEMLKVKLNNPAIFANAQKTPQRFSLDILDKTWMNAITAPFWKKPDEENSEGVLRFERGLKKCG